MPAYLEWFAGRGHEVSLVSYEKVTRDYGVRTFDLSRGASGDRASSKWKYLLAGVSIRRVLREIRPDVLHGHYVTSAGTICLMSGFSPYVLTAHGSDLLAMYKSPVWRPILKVVLGRAALVNTVSEELRAVAEELKVRPDRILVSTLGVDTGLFSYQPPSPLGRPVRLLCTRSLDGVYDPATIVKAVGVVRDRGYDVTLTFAASGPLQGQVADWVRERRLGERVRFLGGYRNSDLPQVLRAHDFYLSASIWDGTSICLLEAMASGIAPIVSRIPSNTAWLTDGQTALMFGCGNSEELADCICRAVTDDGWRPQAVASNRETVMQRADRTKNMLRLEQRLVEIVRKS
jgi:glycosyltransferase involved in cell wall biosynthesis